MRRAKLQSRDEIVALLTNVGTCILGCIDTRGYPYQTPMNYEYADHSFYLVALKQPMWRTYVLSDARVALYIADGANRLLAQGRAEQVEEPLFMRRALEHRWSRRTKSHDPAGRRDGVDSTASGALPDPVEQRRSASTTELYAPTWFCVHSYELFIQQESVWRRCASYD